MIRILAAVALVLALAAPALAGPMYVGDFAVNSTVRCYWNTNGQDGASITRSTDGTLKIYKDSSTTERTSLTGCTQTEDFDSSTGVHLISCDTSDNTDSGFWQAGHEYAYHMTGMTIDTKTVNAAVCSFSIERSGGVLAVLKQRTLGVTIDSGLIIVAPATSQVINVLIRDAATGLGRTGITSSETGLTIRACRYDQGNANCSTITPAAATRGTFTSGGIIAKDDSGAPGIVEFSVPNTHLTTGADRLELYFSCTNCVPTKKTVELIPISLQAVYDRLGAPAGASHAADVASVKTDTSSNKTKLDAISLTSGNVNCHVQATAGNLTYNLTGDITGSISGSCGSVVNPVKVGGVYRKNVAGQGAFTLDLRQTGSLTPFTGSAGSVTAQVNPDGTGWVTAGGTVSGGGAGGLGTFWFSPSQTDTNCGHCAFRFSATGAEIYRKDILTDPTP